LEGKKTGRDRRKKEKEENSSGWGPKNRLALCENTVRLEGKGGGNNNKFRRGGGKGSLQAQGERIKNIKSTVKES